MPRAHSASLLTKSAGPQDDKNARVWVRQQRHELSAAFFAADFADYADLNNGSPTGNGPRFLLRNPRPESGADNAGCWGIRLPVHTVQGYRPLCVWTRFLATNYRNGYESSRMGIVRAHSIQLVKFLAKRALFDLRCVSPGRKVGRKTT